jgi:hypothetical protein
MPARTRLPSPWRRPHCKAAFSRYPKTMPLHLDTGGAPCAEPLVTLEEVQQAAQRRGLRVSVSSLGPFYRVVCRDTAEPSSASKGDQDEGGRIVGVTTGFVAPWFNGIMRKFACAMHAGTPIRDAPPLSSRHEALPASYAADCDALQVFTRGLKGAHATRRCPYPRCCIATSPPDGDPGTQCVKPCVPCSLFHVFHHAQAMRVLECAAARWGWACCWAAPPLRTARRAAAARQRSLPSTTTHMVRTPSGRATHVHLAHVRAWACCLGPAQQG